MNTAADFLSRLEIDPNEKIILRVREDIPKKPFEVNIGFTGIAQEEPVFFDTADQHEPTEKEPWKQKNTECHTNRATSHHSVVLLREWPT